MRNAFEPLQKSQLWSWLLSLVKLGSQSKTEIVGNQEAFEQAPYNLTMLQCQDFLNKIYKDFISHEVTDVAQYNPGQEQLPLDETNVASEDDRFYMCIIGCLIIGLMVVSFLTILTGNTFRQNKRALKAQKSTLQYNTEDTKKGFTSSDDSDEPKSDSNDDTKEEKSLDSSDGMSSIDLAGANFSSTGFKDVFMSKYGNQFMDSENNSDKLVELDDGMQDDETLVASEFENLSPHDIVLHEIEESGKMIALAWSEPEDSTSENAEFFDQAQMYESYEEFRSSKPSQSEMSEELKRTPSNENAGFFKVSKSRSKNFISMNIEKVKKQNEMLHPEATDRPQTASRLNKSLIPVRNPFPVLKLNRGGPENSSSC